MWARVTRYQFPVAEVEKVIDQFNAAAEAISTEAGLKRIDVLASRKSGAGISMSVWESVEAMKASKDAADQLRQEIALELIGWVQSVEEYELVRSDTL